MAASGRVAVFPQPRTAEIVVRPAPTPAPDEVRVRLEGCGVCGSNLPVWEGRPWFEYPRPAGSPGHEGWGVIDALGADVDGLQVGDRVALLSYHAFAEYDVAPAAHVVRLPATLDGQPFPGEALGCAMNVFSRSAIVAGETVAIVGVGFLGALVAALAAGAGARVVALSRRDFSRAMARRMGAAETISTADPAAAVQAVREWTSGAGCACVVEATGLQAPLDLASELTAERGRLVIAGYHQDGMRRVNMQQWNWRGLDVINAHERDPARYLQGMRRAADAIAAGELDPSPLYTDQLPLERIADAFDGLGQRPETFLKAVLTYD